MILTFVSSHGGRGGCGGGADMDIFSNVVVL
jgi:hypothetical protein